VATIKQIRKSKFYMALAPYIVAKDRAEFARMLSLIDENKAYADFSRPNTVCAAFTWYKTPQGHDYWRDLDNSLCASGAYREAKLSGY